MKSVIFAAKNAELFKALKNSEQYEIRNIPYMDTLIEIVSQHAASVVIFDPFLVSKTVDPKAMLYNVAMMDNAPQIIFLAGNLDKKDELIQFAINCDVRDIVFNPVSAPNDDVTEDMRKEIMDRIERPRKLRDLFAELGIKNSKQIPQLPLESIEKIEEEETRRPAPSDAFSYFEEQKTQTPTSAVKVQRPYVVGVISPASSGATFVAQNVACVMAHKDFTVALIDFDHKRTLHYVFGRDATNESFTNLFERDEVEGERTAVQGLHAFTSKVQGSFIGDLGWMGTVEKLPYEIVVLDFSSGFGWREDLLLRALQRCDELLFVGDMDYVKTQQARRMLELLSQKNMRYVLNKWIPERLDCELSDVAPIYPSYFVPFDSDAVRASVYGMPLVELKPDLQSLFVLKDLQTV